MCIRDRPEAVGELGGQLLPEGLDARGRQGGLAAEGVAEALETGAEAVVAEVRQAAGHVDGTGEEAGGLQRRGAHDVTSVARPSNSQTRVSGYTCSSAPTQRRHIVPLW